MCEMSLKVAFKDLLTTKVRVWLLVMWKTRIVERDESVYRRLLESSITMSMLYSCGVFEAKFSKGIGENAERPVAV